MIYVLNTANVKMHHSVVILIIIMDFFNPLVLLQWSRPGPRTEEPDSYICRHFTGILQLCFLFKGSVDFTWITLFLINIYIKQCQDIYKLEL